jgi:hypothetical protein
MPVTTAPPVSEKSLSIGARASWPYLGLLRETNDTLKNRDRI